MSQSEDVFDVIKEAGSCGITNKEIRDKTGLNLSQVTLAISNLKSREWIQRGGYRECPCGRNVVLYVERPGC